MYCVSYIDHFGTCFWSRHFSPFCCHQNTKNCYWHRPVTCLTNSNFALVSLTPPLNFPCLLWFAPDVLLYENTVFFFYLLVFLFFKGETKFSVMQSVHPVIVPPETATTEQILVSAAQGRLWPKYSICGHPTIVTFKL